ncbi:hypothetical protein [Spirosoma validum]|uniref:Lipoprotein n=1 Tax=Spirosoma validum TaxID=2771355 RepID=A0A927GCV0_9BACT|nr:hypothetical protein [Spirosoma validum]MBD2752876.1 hypothetical protein [Spirosoma validum]
MNKAHAIRKTVLLHGLVLLISLSVFGCFTEPTYPNAPQITFKGISRYTLAAGTGVGQQKRDSLVITVGFTDGNGDLGNDLPISSSEMNRYRQAGNWGNYKIRAFRLENKQYKELSTGENTFLAFPRLSREGRTGAIEGDLELKQLYPYTQPYKFFPTKYRIQIRDRALNVSNEIETDTISVPYLYKD